MTVGYNLYRGVGGLSSVDFDTLLGTATTAETSKTFSGLGHIADTIYTYALRSTRDADDATELECPDYSCTVEFLTNGSAEWDGLRPPMIRNIRAQVLSGAKIKVSWDWRTGYGATAPADFGVYYSTSLPISTGSPSDTVTYTRDGRYSKTFTLTNATTYWFGVTARTSGGVESRLSPTAGPLVADSAAPSAPALTVGASS